MPNQFFSPEGDLENYFVTEYWLIDQYVGDELWSWGLNTSGQLGTNDTTNRLTPVTTFSGGTNWKQVSCGANNTSAVKTDGTLWVWGSNTSGPLGTNDTTNRLTPVTTFSGGTNWKQVSCGGNHTAAIKTDGTLWIWGLNTSGQLGTNDTTNRLTPVTTFSGGTNWKQVSCGGSHTAAIKNNGTLWVWGRILAVGVGFNDALNDTRLTPVTTFSGGTNWKQVSSGSDHVAAIKTDGTLWVWGESKSGKLGTNDNTNRLTPVTTFSGGTNWKQVSCGPDMSTAIKTDGTLWTWGLNVGGQLGTNDTTDRLTPVTTFAGGTNWKQVSNTTAAIKTDGTLWTWGYASYGRLGTNNSTPNRLTPVTTFYGGTNWKQVSGGNFNIAAVFSGTTPNLPIS